MYSPPKMSYTLKNAWPRKWGRHKNTVKFIRFTSVGDMLTTKGHLLSSECNIKIIYCHIQFVKYFLVFYFNFPFWLSILPLDSLPRGFDPTTATILVCEGKLSLFILPILDIEQFGTIPRISHLKFFWDIYVFKILPSELTIPPSKLCFATSLYTREALSTQTFSFYEHQNLFI